MCDDHTFPSSQTVSLDCDGIIELSQRLGRRLNRIRADEARGWNTRALHEFLGINLAAFELRVFFRWSKDEESAGAELVHDASHQWNFRADYREIGLNRFGDT